jgi:putative cardiolipin synthase
MTRLPPRSHADDSQAAPPGTETWLDQRIEPFLLAHAGASGFALVADGVEAFALRALSARRAGRSLDIQYYIWKDDLTGRLLVHELVDAAERGVRVRLLLDDLDARAKDFALGALDAHPNIEVRVFNPFASRRGLAGKLLELVTGFSRINHRMHNKVFIVDNRLAITGGRNIGDEYFAASDSVNFLDLDLKVIGPAVLALSDTFDAYWNSAAVWPIADLKRASTDVAELRALRARADAELERAFSSRYVRSLTGDDAVQRVLSFEPAMHWTREWQVLADDPRKSLQKDCAFERSAVLRALDAAMRGARTSVTLVSPYFVPGVAGTEGFRARAGAGIELVILTNSLAATDVAAVHGGYAKYRMSLIVSGVQLWELKPDPTSLRVRPSLFGSSNASLHTKAAVFDRQRLFVGSFNLDPRSVSLNCEQGVLLDDAALSCAVTDLLAHKMSGELAWRVQLDARGHLQWSDGHEQFQSEPRATWGRRLLARLVGSLPFESQL